MDIPSSVSLLVRKFKPFFISCLIIITIIYFFYDGYIKESSNLIKTPKPIIKFIKNNNKGSESNSFKDVFQNVGNEIGSRRKPPIGPGSRAIISNLIKTKQSKTSSKGKFFINVAFDLTTTEFVVASQFCKRSGCANRQNIFDSKSSKSFRSSFGKSQPIKYLDGSSVSGTSGADSLTFNTFSNSNPKFGSTKIILAKQISGLLRAQAAVEGVMGLGAKSPIWNQLQRSRLDQVVGIAIPLGNCKVGSIAFGGLDSRFVNGPLYNTSLKSSNSSTYSVSINVLYVGGIPLNSTVIDSILDIENERISLGKFSREFFGLLKAKKKSNGFFAKNPVDISFDVTLSDDEIVQFTLPKSSICESGTRKGKGCITIFDDKPGPE
ncbi:2833_t:CDS:2, partial [Racocetra persica]